MENKDNSMAARELREVADAIRRLPKASECAALADKADAAIADVAELVAAADHILSPEAAGLHEGMAARKRLMDALAKFA